jgi:hypothetical protein
MMDVTVRDEVFFILQPIPDTDPPQFDLKTNVVDGIKKKTGLENADLGEVRPVGVAFWRNPKMDLCIQPSSLKLKF